MDEAGKRGWALTGLGLGPKTPLVGQQRLTEAL